MKRPIWVALGLSMLQTREHAMSYLIAASVGAVLVFVGTIVVMPIFFGSTLLAALETAASLGGLLGVAALWYWLSIRWMDKHGQW
jgi:predicted ABC-type exoprotein transport system permease subunit